MINEIVLAYDGSEHAKHAAEIAKEIAQQFSATVRIVYAFHPLSRVRGDPEMEQAMQRAVAEGNAIVEPIAAEFRAAGLDAHSEILEGPPADAILRVAQVRGTNLIAIGSRGLGSAKAMLLGSVSHKVLQEADCPVLIAK